MKLSSLTIPENSNLGTVVGFLSVKDEDQMHQQNNQTMQQSHTFEIIQQNPKHLFSINIANELVVAVDNKLCLLRGGSYCVFNFEKNPFVSVRIRVTDDGFPPKSLETTFKIVLTDVNESPRCLRLSNAIVPENATIGHVIGTFTFDDEDLKQQHTITLLDDSHGRFDVDVHNNLVKAKKVDYEMEANHFINVLLQDNGNPPFSVRFKTFGNCASLTALFHLPFWNEPNDFKMNTFYSYH